MLKKQIAIFALFIFFFAQFGKVINYCYCKAVVYEQTKNFVCDCEKRLYTLINTDKSSSHQPAQTIAPRLPVEELFHPSAIPLSIIHPAVCLTVWPTSESEGLYHAFAQGIFKPPLRLS